MRPITIFRVIYVFCTFKAKSSSEYMSLSKCPAFSLCSVFALRVRTGVHVPTSCMPKQHEREAELERIYGRFMLQATFSKY